MLRVVMVPEGVSEADTNVVVEAGTRQVVGDTENVVVKVVEMRSAGGGSGYLGLGGVGGAEQGGVGLGVAYSTQGVGEQMPSRWGMWGWMRGSCRWGGKPRIWRRLYYQCGGQVTEVDI